MICPNCNHENSDKNIRFCENCGYELQNIKKPKNKKKTIAVISVLLVVIISVVSCTAFYYFHTTSNNQKSKKEDKYYMSSSKLVIYNSEDAPNENYYTKYNENGKVLEIKDPIGPYMFFNYDADGKIIQIVITDIESKENETFNFSYSNKNDENIGVAIIQDEENQRIIQCIYDSDNCIKEYSITETDSNGNSTVLQREIYDKSGKTVQYFDKNSQTSYEYNEQGIVVYEKTTDLSSNEISESKYEYDEDGITKLKTESYENGKPDKLLTFYHEIVEDTRNETNGILKLERYDGYDKYIGYEIINYLNGVKSKSEFFYPSGELRMRKLYDEYGHLTNESSYDKGKKYSEDIYTWELKASAKNTKGE